MARALYYLGRYAEAAARAQQCVQRAPTQVTCRATLVAALGQIRPASELQAEVARLLELSPGFTVAEDSRLRSTTTRSAADTDHFAEGLRKAGVPE